MIWGQFLYPVCFDCYFICSFSSDTFDSTSTDVEDVPHDNRDLTRTTVHGQDNTQRSRHQAVLPETHLPSSYQPYGHHVTKLSNKYGGQLQGQHLSGHPEGQTSIHHRQHRQSMSQHDAADFAARESRKVRLDHRQLVGHRKDRRQSNHTPTNHTPQQHHNPLSPRTKAYHATQWHADHTWQPVTYEVNRDSAGGTPPTRDIEMPAQNAPLQPNTLVVGKYQPKSSDQVLSTNPSNQRTVGTPIQSFHQQVPVPQYVGHTVAASYGTPTSEHNAQVVPGHAQGKTSEIYRSDFFSSKISLLGMVISGFTTFKRKTKCSSLNLKKKEKC